MEGNTQIIQLAQEQNIIPQNYTPPIPELMLSTKFSNESDLSYNFNIILAPTNENSTRAHKAVYCAHEQELFVDMHISLVSDSDLNLSYTFDEYKKIAEEVGLNLEEFEQCYNNQGNSYIEETEKYLVDKGVSTLPIIIVGHYPSTEILDLEALLLLLQSELIVSNSIE